VRHPALAVAFAGEFQKWYFTTKRACKKWRGKKLSDTAVPHLISLPNRSLTKKVKSNTTAMLAQALGEQYPLSDLLQCMSYHLELFVDTVFTRGVPC
jgi:hypothetical protein